jgi:hypothetical protein
MSASRDVLILEQMHVGRRRGSTASCLVMGVTKDRQLLNNTIRGQSGKYPAILNISRTGRVALM